MIVGIDWDLEILRPSDGNLDAIGGILNKMSSDGIVSSVGISDAVFDVVGEELSNYLTTNILAGVVCGDIAGFTVTLAAASEAWVGAEKGNNGAKRVVVSLKLKMCED